MIIRMIRRAEELPLSQPSHRAPGQLPLPTTVSSSNKVSSPYMLEHNTVFYSYLPCFMNTVTLNMYVFLSNTGSTWRNTVFVLLWLRHRNT